MISLFSPKRRVLTSDLLFKDLFYRDLCLATSQPTSPEEQRDHYRKSRNSNDFIVLSKARSPKS